MKRMKRMISLVLCCAMLAGYVPAPAHAEDISQQGLCEHHPEHIDCSYSPAVDEVKCNHNHDDSCYAVTENCTHVHDGCGTEEVPCTHEHSEAEGCIVRTLNCKHEHGNCSYVEQKDEVPCDYICAECNKETEAVCTGKSDCSVSEHNEGCEKKADDDKAAADQTAAAAVAALIDAMPTLEVFQGKAAEDCQAEYQQVMAAYDAYEKLSDEQKALLPPAEEVFKPYFDYFSGQTQVAISGTTGNLHWEWDEEESLLYISGTGAMPDYASAGSQPWSAYATQIKKIEVGYSVTTIGENAFNGCSKASTVILPEGLTAIKSNAFYGCSNLSTVRYNGTDIQWPNLSVSETGNGVLDSTYIEYANSCGTNLTYTLVDGVLTISGTGDMNDYDEDAPWASIKDTITSVVIEDGVTSIGNYAFFRCSKMTTISIPDSVTVIGSRAFSGCSSLTAVTIPKGQTAIYGYTFSGCSSLTQITIPASVSTIWYGAFAGSGLVKLTIPDTVRTIYDTAFKGCTNLTEVTIGKGVTSLGDTTFSNCKSLKSVWFTGNAPSAGAATNFAQSTGTVYYPVNNATWTEENRNAICRHAHWVSYDPCANGHSFVGGVCTVCGKQDCIASGKCGDNLTWELDKDGALTISGTGDMYDYDSGGEKAPWHVYRDQIKNLAIESGVTSIGEDAFYECYGLSSVTVPNSVKKICSGAFLDCSSLTKITLPDQLESIADYTFSQCSALADITIPASVKTIGKQAFYGCLLLKDITIPAAVTAVGDFAFYNCQNLKSITFLGKAPQISDTAFFGVEKVTAYYPANDASWNSVITKQYGGKVTWVCASCKDGHNCDYTDNFDGKTHSQVCSNCGNNIGTENHTFDYFTNILCPCGAAKCGDTLSSHFDEATGKLTISGTGDMKNMGSSNFPWSGYLNSIKSLVVDEGCTSIASMAFHTTQDVASITSVSLPSTLKTVGYSAFYAQNKLTALQLPANLQTIGDYAFGQCDTLTTVTIPDSVTTIADCAFVGCDKLTSIHIGKGLATLEGNVFNNIDGLVTLAVSADNPNFEAQDNVLYTKGLRSLVAFPMNRSGSELEVPYEVSRINSYAFNNPVNLKKLSFETSAPVFDANCLNGFVGEVHYNSTYSGWGTVAGKNYGGTVTWINTACKDGHSYDCINNYDGKTHKKVCSECGDTVASESHDFHITSEYTPYSRMICDCGAGKCGDSLTWHVSDAGVLTFCGSGAMYDFCDTTGDGSMVTAAPWYEKYDKIQEVSFPSGLTHIGAYAFKVGNKVVDGKLVISNTIEEAAIPSTVRSIGTGAFAWCSELRRVNFSSGLETIGEYAFSQSGLSSATISDTVTSIGNYAFSSCEDLDYIIIPGSVRSIGEYAFKNCQLGGLFSSSGAGVTLGDGIESIGEGAFWGSWVKSISLPDSVTYMGPGVFNGCINLQSVKLPKDLTEILDFTFRECTRLASITIPDSVISIGRNAFKESALSSVALPEGLKTIGESAFQKTRLLKEIIIPANVTSIGKYAFDYSGLNKVTFLGNPPGFGDSPFQDVTANVYYYDNGKWNNTNKLQYGGALTWIPMEQPDVSGQCGTSAFWSYKPSTKTLSITGSGAMYDYCYSESKEEWTNAPGWLGFDLDKVTIASGITTIGGYAFYDMPIADAVTLPDTVTEVRYNAFQGSYATIINSKNLATVGSSAFSGTKIDKVYGAVTVGDGAFSSVTFTDASVVVTGEVCKYAFFGSNIATLTLTENVKYVRDFSLSGCADLTAIYFCCNKPDFGNNVYDGGGVTGNTVTYYRSSKATGFANSTAVWADEDHATIKGTPVPPTCTEDGYTPMICPYCSIVVKSNVVPAGHNVVDGICTVCGVYGTCGEKLTWTLKDGTLTISGTGDMYDYDSGGKKAPWHVYRDQIKNLAIESGVTSIGEDAFYECYGLSSVTVPNSVKKISSGAFLACSSLTAITLPDQLGSIADYTFSQCAALADITIPESVKTIGKQVFDSCLLLRDITIPAAVIAVGDFAFYNCRNLQTMTFLGKAPQISDSAFTGVENLTAYYPANDTSWANVITKQYGGKVTWVAVGAPTLENIKVSTQPVKRLYVQNKDALDVTGGKLTLTYSDRSTEVIDMTADMVTGFDNTKLGRQKLTVTYGGFTVYLTVTVQVDINATSGTWGNLNWNIDESGTLTISGTGDMVHFRDGWEALFVPPIDGYPWHRHRDSITSVVVKEGVTSLAEIAFHGLKNLTSVTLPDSLVTIDDAAFSFCTSLESITMPANVATIGQEIFIGSTSFKEITFVGNAPSFDTAAFGEITATAIYPAANKSWTADVMDDYGGHITWKPDGIVAETLAISKQIQETVVGLEFTLHTTFAPNDSSVRLVYETDDLVEVVYYMGANHNGISLRAVKSGITTVKVKDMISGLTDSVTITAKDPTVLTCPYEGKYTTPGDNYYAFTPAVTGQYMISLENIHNFWGNIVGISAMEQMNGNSVSDGVISSDETSTRYTATLQAGTTYLIQVGYHGMEPLKNAILRLEAVQTVTGIDIVREKMTLWLDEHGWWASAAIPVTFRPANAAAQVTWTSSDPAVISAEDAAGNTGYFIMHKEGTAVITATCGAYSDSVEVTVKYAPELTLGVPMDSVCDYGIGKIFKFTAEEAGTYIFSAESEANLYLYTDEHSPYNRDGSILKELKAGETAYFLVFGTNMDADQKEYSVRIDKSTTATSMDLVFHLDGREQILTIYPSYEPTNGLDSIEELTVSNPELFDHVSWNLYDASLGITGSGETVISVTTEGDLTASKTIVVGPCGTKAAWILDEDGTLTISGSGDMPDLSNGAPWVSWKDRIKSVVIEPGITGIGHYSFEGLSNLTEVTIPDTVTLIGEAAFGSCSSLENIDIPEGVISISCSAFAQASALKKINFPASLEIAGPFCFDGCTSLEEVVFQGDYPDLSDELFATVTITAYYPATNDTWTEDVLKPYGGNVTWLPYGAVNDRLVLDLSELGGQTTVWIDGIACEVHISGSKGYVEIPHEDAKTMVIYTYHVGDANDVHTQYPISMKVWALEKQKNGSYKANRVEALDDILQYSGSSIRITGNKGIRMITSVPQEKKNAMVSGDLAGYKLLEYGTVLAQVSKMADGPLVLGPEYAKSNYAYKRGVADPVFAYAGDLVQYTNVLVGFTNDQCKEDIAMRPYMILENEKGEQVTLYGGIVYRSIGYIAYQNRSVFAVGSAAYNYVWEIIHHVYGDKYDAEYKG